MQIIEVSPESNICHIVFGSFTYPKSVGSSRQGFLGCFCCASPLFEIARVLVRFDHVALMDLTRFCIFRVTFEPDFTHYLV
jgi:hypothetical protein